MSPTTSTGELVEQLKRSGQRPPVRLVERILAADTEAHEPLIALAADVPLLYEPEPVCWAPVHALRLLGELRPVTMIHPLLRTLPIHLHDDNEYSAPRIWSREVLEMIAFCGSAALPLLWEWVDKEAQNAHSRLSAVLAMVFIGVHTPETYDEIVSAARERLTHETSTGMVTSLVYVLAHLGVSDAYQEVMAAFRAKRVQTDVINAADARQYLMRKPDQDDPEYSMGMLFWERYALDEPFIEQNAGTK